MNNKTNTNFCNQTNLPCYINAQRWYFVNALNKINITKNKQKKKYYSNIISYYTSGRINN